MESTVVVAILSLVGTLGGSIIAGIVSIRHCIELNSLNVK